MSDITSTPIRPINPMLSQQRVDQEASDTDMLKTINLWDTVVPIERAPVKALVLESLNHSTTIGQRLEVGQQMTVGRTAEATHAMPEDCWMSRVHFSLECSNSHATLRDFDSTNGTFLNGVRVGKTSVYDGDQITAGRNVFIVRLLAEI